LLKNFAGRRCDQKALQQRFLAQPDGLHAVRRVLRSQHSFLSAICVYPRPSAVKFRFESLVELISDCKCSSVVQMHDPVWIWRPAPGKPRRKAMAGRKFVAPFKLALLPRMFSDYFFIAKKSCPTTPTAAKSSQNFQSRSFS
jgi:hypothetical protein